MFSGILSVEVDMLNYLPRKKINAIVYDMTRKMCIP